MSRTITIKKGLDINLISPPMGGNVNDTNPIFAIIPSDYPGYIWKSDVKEGDDVLSGTPLLHAKEDEQIRICSPVAGKIKEIKRGERRKIEYISIHKSENLTSLEIPNNLEILERLKLSGLFVMIRQRPFDIVPQSAEKPVNIFVTGFDSAPLAPDLIKTPLLPYLEKGLDTLNKLTSGKVYLSVRAESGITSNVAEIVLVAGPHPAGNTGTQMAAIQPVNKGENVWMLDIITACRIGKLMETNKADFSTDVVVVGPEVEHPHTVSTWFGASIQGLGKECFNSSKEDIRIISGNVLTGIPVSANGFLRYPYRQLTVIPEGAHRDEFMGWASMNPKRYSVSHAFPAFLRGLKKPFQFDARIKGGERAMIMSGEYDKVFPMDIYPEYLLKAIMAKNIDRMEQLGIYEVAPEDFALCEFVDSSKLELQKIVREGLDYLRKETM